METGVLGVMHQLVLLLVEMVLLFRIEHAIILLHPMEVSFVLEMHLKELIVKIILVQVKKKQLIIHIVVCHEGLVRSKAQTTWNAEP